MKEMQIEKIASHGKPAYFKISLPKKVKEMQIEKIT